MRNYDIREWGGDFDGQSQGLAFPFARIRQKTLMNEEGDQVVSAAGTFQFTDDRTVGKELPIIFLFSTRGRVMWENIEDERPVCRSFNAKEPQQPIFANRCAECPHSVWGAGGQRPKCDETISMLCLDTDMKPFIMQFKGTGLDPATKFINRVIKLANDNKCAPWCYAFVLTTRKVEKNTYTYYVPVFPEDATGFTLLDDEVIDEVEAIRDEIFPDWKRSVNPPTESLAAPATAALPPTGVVMPVEEGSFPVGVAQPQSANPFAKKNA